MAVQDIHHIKQKDEEMVVDFLVCLERTFQIAFGHDPLIPETRDTLLHGQLQHGLNTDIIRVPAIS